MLEAKNNAGVLIAGVALLAGLLTGCGEETVVEEAQEAGPTAEAAILGETVTVQSEVQDIAGPNALTAGDGLEEGTLILGQGISEGLFDTLLRDGFARTAAGDNGSFAAIGTEALRVMFNGMELNRDIEPAVQHVMAGLSGLRLHPDVTDGIEALYGAGFRLATLTNGSTQVAEKLFAEAGIRDRFELLLSVENAPAGKPGRASYEYAVSACGTMPEEMLLVAVHPWDIHGASRAGLATAWINRTGGPYPDYFQAPDNTVSSLAELASALPGS